MDAVRTEQLELHGTTVQTASVPTALAVFLLGLCVWPVCGPRPGTGSSQCTVSNP